MANERAKALDRPPLFGLSKQIGITPTPKPDDELPHLIYDLPR
jgi:hypothetical protein